MYYLLLTLFIITALLLILLVLMQRGRGDVGSAFGGMGQGVFGPGGVDTILTKTTYWLGFTLMALALLLALTHPSKKGSLIKDEGKGTPPIEQSVPQGKGAPSSTPAQDKP
ncbi:MAG: preprotein translocase subunit SecG [Aquificaceae bacterium]